jgi:hypothetical protein
MATISGGNAMLIFSAVLMDGTPRLMVGIIPTKKIAKGTWIGNRLRHRLRHRLKCVLGNDVLLR